MECDWLYWPEGQNHLKKLSSSGFITSVKDAKGERGGTGGNRWTVQAGDSECRVSVVQASQPHSHHDHSQGHWSARVVYSHGSHLNKGWAQVREVELVHGQADRSLTQEVQRPLLSQQISSFMSSASLHTHSRKR